MKKQRGKFLTLMIVFAIIGLIQMPYYLVNTNAITQAYGILPSWYSIYAIVGFSAGVCINVGLWLMKKWAAYLLIVSTVLTFLSQLFILKPLAQYAGMTYVMTMISAGLWFWAIWRKWNLFD